MVAMVRCRKRLGIGVSGPGTAVKGVAVTGAVAVYVERPIPKDISFEVSSKECDARFKLVAASVEEMEVELNGDRGPDKWFDEMLKVCDADDWRIRLILFLDPALTVGFLEYTVSCHSLLFVGADAKNVIRNRVAISLSNV